MAATVKEKMHTIEIPLNGDRDDDVTVGINGKFTKIRRGEEVEVSDAVYEVLMNSKAQEKVAREKKKQLEAKQ